MENEEIETVEIVAYSCNLPIQEQIQYASIGFGAALTVVVPLLVMSLLAKAHRAGEGSNYD